MELDDDYGSASVANHVQALYPPNLFTEDDRPPRVSVAYTNCDLQGSSVNKSRRRRTSGSDHSASSRTTDIYASNDSLLSPMHPLRSAGFTSAFNVAGITRPHLARMVGVGTLVDAPPLEPNLNFETQSQERDVLVHRVSPGDSLPGISLKYGISLANLRRANHLWASDSIHLRTVLYIPLEQASRIKKTPTDNILIEQSFQPLEHSNGHLRAQHSSLETIQRVPPSQLSFFPPPKVTQLTPSSQVPLNPTAIPNHARSSSYPSQSLTSLLTTLPIVASTRDTFIGRLSFDGISSSYSDRESAYSAEDMELDDVKHVAQLNNLLAIDLESQVPVTPKATHRIAHAAVSPASSSQSHQMDLRHLSSSPKSYIPPHPQIRTVQLEPSPMMHIPSRSSLGRASKGKSRARANVLDMDFELRDTGSVA